MSRVFISTALVASVAAQTCANVGSGGFMFPVMGVADTACTDIAGCTLLPALKLCFPAATAQQLDPDVVATPCGDPIDGACSVIGCKGAVADQELTCNPTSCEPDEDACARVMAGPNGAPESFADLVDFPDSACSGQCGVITTKYCYDPNPVASPTVAPAPTAASCYYATSMSACVAMDDCVGIDASIKLPCDDPDASGFQCMPCVNLGGFSSEQPIVKWLQENQGKTWEAENAAGDGSYELSVTALDASSCSWYADADASEVTEVEALNFAVGQFTYNNYMTDIPADREVATTAIDTSSAAPLSVVAAAFAAALVL